MMTIKELTDLITVEVDDPADEGGITHSADAAVVGAMRLSECVPAAGARVDLCCHVCGQRVCLGPTAVKKVENGCALACFACVEIATGISREDFPEGSRELGSKR